MPTSCRKVRRDFFGALAREARKVQIYVNRIHLKGYGYR